MHKETAAYLLQFQHSKAGRGVLYYFAIIQYSKYIKEYKQGTRMISRIPKKSLEADKASRLKQKPKPNYDLLFQYQHLNCSNISAARN